MADVRIENVRKRFDGQEVVRGVDIEIADGAFVVLVGPSGCGKSTLLRMIAGLERVSDGDIRVDGEVINTVPPSDRDIAMVFQNYALYPHMTVRENMTFALRLQRTSRKEITARVERAADILGLSPLLSRYPRQLSGGQRQRVAMGRAIVRDPKVFLFDEPLSNLDAKLRVQMRTEIKELHQRLKTTTIYVTHDQIEAMTLADTIVVMQDGVVEQIGTPLEVYDHPKTAFVAGFIGSPAMNMMTGTLVEEAGTVAFEGTGGVRLPIREEARPHLGRPLIYGIRPEAIEVRADGPVAGSVAVVEPTGAETLIFARVGEGHFVVTSKERLTLPPGGPIALAPDLAKVHLFDAETGQSLLD